MKNGSEEPAGEIEVVDNEVLNIEVDDLREEEEEKSGIMDPDVHRMGPTQMPASRPNTNARGCCDVKRRAAESRPIINAIDCYASPPFFRRESLRLVFSEPSSESEPFFNWRSAGFESVILVQQSFSTCPFFLQ